MRARRVALVVLLGLLVGCRGVPFRPDAFSRAVRIEDLTLRFQPEGTGLLTLTLEVRNPASDAALLTGVDFALEVDGRRLAVGFQQVEVPLAENGLPHPVQLTFPLVSEGAVGSEAPRWRRVRVSGGVLLRYGPSTERRATFMEVRELRLSWVPLPEPRLE